jgi:hypothetical protein
MTLLRGREGDREDGWKKSMSGVKVIGHPDGQPNGHVWFTVIDMVNI